MKNIDKTVIFETKYIACFVIILSALMQAIFLIFGKWNYTVLLGNLLSASVAVLNFFLMGITIQKSLGKEDKQARNYIQLSQTARIFMQFLAAAIGVLLPCFNIITSLVPLFFPRIAISFRGLFFKKATSKSDDGHQEQE